MCWFNEIKSTPEFAAISEMMIFLNQVRCVCLKLGACLDPGTAVVVCFMKGVKITGRQESTHAYGARALDKQWKIGASRVIHGISLGRDE